MKIGAIVPQGWVGEYDGWKPLDAWRRTTEVAKAAEKLGFESIWLFDHFHTVPRPTDEITFESFTSLSALAALTGRVRLGHIVICTAFRNPALTAKMISTMDSISGGRMELGIGAGWKRDEWLAYGYGFPETRERLARLGDDLEVIKAMLAGDKHQHATFEGKYARVRDARNIPKPIQQPRTPIMVGGNGPNVTWRLAARHADELNVDGMSPSEVAAAMPVIRSRCEEIGRDPATLPVSVHIWEENLSRTGAQRVDLLAGYREQGVSRVMGLDRAVARSDEALERLAQDARAAGVELAS
ncbi:MAG TPA: TIGR03560 family F420-dependent LLM class oxidoreductase [Candidatus Limnocylindrales bacterium]|nr:TIGR03560 family F420-dependent LLM class oxidoreductase [Candidatus Limnocylindrales bacterium]